MLHFTEDYQWVPACEGRDTIYASSNPCKHYNWVPACGGKETPFKGRDGKVTTVYRKRWVIHVERVTRDKVNGATVNVEATVNLSDGKAMPLIAPVPLKG